MSSIKTLLETMRILRDKDNGCPWDIEQTLESLSPCVVEEAYEVSDAIARNDYENLKEELGDVLLQVIFQAEIANELKLFNFDEIVDALNEKLIRRHPHVFDGASKPLSAIEQTQAWDAIKAQEKKSNDTLNTFDDIPASLPPILKAKKIQKKASKKGFDWKESIDVIKKVEEELKELKYEIQQNNKQNTQEELGDLLFSCINLSRKLGLDTETVIRESNRKFEKRFKKMEKNMNSKKLDWKLKNLEKEWEKSK